MRDTFQLLRIWIEPLKKIEAQYKRLLFNVNTIETCFSQSKGFDISYFRSLLQTSSSFLSTKIFKELKNFELIPNNAIILNKLSDSHFIIIRVIKRIGLLI